jgi:hypothetical protein
MDHNEAVRCNAVERYTLGDLPFPEVEDFERHYFECPQCSEELRTLSVLALNARALFSEETAYKVVEATPAAPPKSEPRVVVQPPPAVIPWWRQPWSLGPAFAAVAFAVLAGYQTMVSIPNLQHQASRVQAVSGYPLFAEARGEENVLTPSEGASSYVVYMDKPSEVEPARYHASVQDEKGAERYSLDLSNPGPAKPVMLNIPVNSLTNGHYVVVLQGKDSAGKDLDSARYPFTLKLQ